MKVIVHTLSKGSKFETPYYIAIGDQPGNAVIVTAGVHGNEPASVLAAGNAVADLRGGVLQIARGTLIIVPLVNREAYRRKTRGYPGVPDLNRTFPRRPGDPARHPLSDALFRLAREYRAAWYFDLHEANGLSRLNPKVLGQTLIANPGNSSIPAVERTIAKINRSISLPNRHYTMRLRGLPGSGRHAAHHLLQIRAVTVETCWSLPLAHRISYHANILRLLLGEAGILEASAAVKP
ncbi:deacylase [Cohnella sp. CFH 77786]|uniref:succinylglutamate desuccinylase/aspartoacylase domain-containing protein n=1 Tax=Cohnella sp. CFH 77786 TaxID=2662265 RepID=UPI001C609164|nr:succinylglutamate desuccinylase/aspartoacylase family protein [Cohnella sp. CFH 77786]MBW5446316.1 deacylase [Cohnella sp. CFH 77786]